MNDKLNIPHCIKNYGKDSYPTEQGFVPEDVFLERLHDIAVQNAIADACTGSNPRQPSVEEMEKLLKCCYYDTEVDFLKKRKQGKYQNQQSPFSGRSGIFGTHQRMKFICVDFMWDTRGFLCEIEREPNLCLDWKNRGVYGSIEKNRSKTGGMREKDAFP